MRARCARNPNSQYFTHSASAIFQECLKQILRNSLHYTDGKTKILRGYALLWYSWSSNLNTQACRSWSTGQPTSLLSVTSWAGRGCVSHRLRWGWFTPLAQCESRQELKKMNFARERSPHDGTGLDVGNWGKMDFCLKPRTSFLSGSNILPMVTSGRIESSTTRIKYFLGTFTLVMLLKGLRKQMWDGMGDMWGLP